MNLRSRMVFVLAALGVLGSGALSCSSAEVRCEDDPNAPPDLKCTGLYADWGSKTLAAGVLPYKPGLELWSDGADKSRYLLLPPGTRIDTSNQDEWWFPVGTKVWKEFRVGGRRVETRLLWKRGDNDWYYTAYLWSDDGSSAPKIEGGKKGAAPGYDIPDTVGCLKCHKGRNDLLLGIEAVSLALPNAEGATLTALKDKGLLTAPPPATTLALPEDQTGKAAAALGWLHVNCGESCHNRNSRAEGRGPDALYTALSAKRLFAGPLAPADTDAFLTSANQRITDGKFFRYTQQGYVRMKPGSSSKSLMAALSALRDGDLQMPPFASHQVDPSGVAALNAWIDALPP